MRYSIMNTHPDGTKTYVKDCEAVLIDGKACFNFNFTRDLSQAKRWGNEREKEIALFYIDAQMNGDCNLSTVNLVMGE